MYVKIRKTKIIYKQHVSLRLYNFLQITHFRRLLQNSYQYLLFIIDIFEKVDLHK